MEAEYIFGGERSFEWEHFNGILFMQDKSQAQGLVWKAEVKEKEK